VAHNIEHVSLGNCRTKVGHSRAPKGTHVFSFCEPAARPGHSRVENHGSGTHSSHTTKFDMMKILKILELTPGRDSEFQVGDS
jgi:hypothetical protein